MKILWEPFSFVSTPFVRLCTRPKPHRYVIAIAVFILFSLFAQCISHDSTADKQENNAIPTLKRWLNDSNAPTASDARVAISKPKRQSPTKVSNSSSSSRMSARSYGSTDVPTPRGHQAKSIPFPSDGSNTPTTSPSSSSHTKFATTNGKQQSSGKEASSTNNVLILIQTKENIELNSVRDQFQQFTDMFGVTLANITIDFDAIDGK